MNLTENSGDMRSWFNRLLKKSSGWFDRLTTNVLILMNSISSPFSLSALLSLVEALSEGE